MLHLEKHLEIFDERKKMAAVYGAFTGHSHSGAAPGRIQAATFAASFISRWATEGVDAFLLPSRSRASVKSHSLASGSFFVYRPEEQARVSRFRIPPLLLGPKMSGPSGGAWFCLLQHTQSPSPSSGRHHQVNFGRCSKCTGSVHFHQPPVIPSAMLLCLGDMLNICLCGPLSWTSTVQWWLNTDSQFGFQIKPRRVHQRPFAPVVYFPFAFEFSSTLREAGQSGSVGESRGCVSSRAEPAELRGARSRSRRKERSCRFTFHIPSSASAPAPSLLLGQRTPRSIVSGWTNQDYFQFLFRKKKNKTPYLHGCDFAWEGREDWRFHCRAELLLLLLLLLKVMRIRRLYWDVDSNAPGWSSWLVGNLSHAVQTRAFGLRGSLVLGRNDTVRDKCSDA